MNQSPLCFRAFQTSLLLCLVVPAPAAVAAVLEEILVTAQKREQNLQDVGIAVTAFSGDQLKELGFVTTTDLVQQTPGLTYVPPFGDGNNAAFTLRGVGLNDFSEHNESPVAVYVDEVYQATLAGLGFQLFDLERAEVLKGPQGTLFGRNTSGGLVHMVTRRPTDTFEGYGEATFGEYDQVRLESAAGGPIADTLSGRVSFLYHDHDGYRETRTPGLKDANSTDVWAVRGQVLWQPTVDLEILASAHYATADQISATYEHASTTFAPDGVTEVFVPADQVNPLCAGVGGLTGPGQDCFGYRDTDGDIHATDNDRQTFLDLDTAGVSLHVDWNVAGMTLTSISAFEYLNKFFGEDTDVGPVPAIAVTNPVDSQQWSQELRLAGERDRLRWTTGFFYFNRDVRTGSRTDVSGIGLVNDNTVDSDLTESWALFGQLEYDINDRWTAIGGARYTDEEREFEMIARDDLGNTPFFLGLTPAPVPGFVIFDFTEATVGDLTKQDGDNVSFRFELDWRPVDDWLVYGSVARGVKGFGFNFAIDGTGILGSSTAAQIPFDEEKLMAYELGFKSTLLDGRARLNTSLYYYDYSDFQAFSFEVLTNVVSNKDAEVMGFEAELITNPWEGWEFSFGLNVQDAEVKDVTSANFFTGDPVTRDRDMVLTPDFTFNGLGRYGWAMFGGSMALQLDFRIVGDQYFDIANNPITKEDTYVVGNGRLSWTDASDTWQVALWVKNIGDNGYRTYAIPVTSLGFMQQMIGQPRWVGGTVSYRW
ncbi:MAG: TonB-dependent receptor [Gammaproteobacteria bacterium]|nr:TonB-dependent receptor [Gammaproteobacteria bacterium]